MYTIDRPTQHLLYTTITTLLTFCHGEMFDFHFVAEYRNPTEQEKHCQDLGYDGLAVITTPEAYHYAMKLTEHERIVKRMGTYVGAHYNPVLNISLWDDGTVPRSDSPFFSNPPLAIPEWPVAKIDRNGKLSMGGNTPIKAALCGYHKNFQWQSNGSIMVGAGLQTTSRTILSVSRHVLSYQECALLCGMTPDCRAAEFNSDLLTCTIIGEYTSTGTEVNDQIVTYIRVTF